MFIRVKVFAESKREDFKKVKDGVFEAYVRPKAQFNMANDRVVEMLMEYFPGCRGVRLTSGATRPTKRFEIIEPSDTLFS